MSSNSKLIKVYFKGVFFRSSSFFRQAPSFSGRLRNPALLVPSARNGRFGRPSKPSAPKTGRLRRNSPSEVQLIRNRARL